MVFGRSVRGSAAKATTTSLARARSCAAAGPVNAQSAMESATRLAARLMIGCPSLHVLDVPQCSALVLPHRIPERDGPRVLALDERRDTAGAVLGQPVLRRADQLRGEATATVL